MSDQSERIATSLERIADVLEWLRAEEEEVQRRPLPPPSGCNPDPERSGPFFTPLIIAALVIFVLGETVAITLAFVL